MFNSILPCISPVIIIKTPSKFPNSKIGISSLIHREDINVTEKLSAVNDKVKEMANKDDFVFINNSHTDGRALMAVNYI